MKAWVSILLVFVACSFVSWLAYAVPDVVIIPHARPQGAVMANARFSHRSHGQLQCYACHPSVFPQRREAFTHHEMDEGRYCANCHNGKVAADVKSFACEACHVR